MYVVTEPERTLIYKEKALMKTSTRLALATLLVLPALLAAGCGGTDEVPADAVAVVDGTEIPRAELEAVIERARLSFTSQQQEFPKAGTPEYQSMQAQAVSFLVQRVQYEREAEKLGIEVTEADVDKKLKEVLDQPFYNGDEKKLAADLKKQGYTDETLRADLRSLALRDKLVEALTKDIKVGAAEIEKHYSDNKAQYTVPESREVRHILLAVKKKDGTIDYVKSKVQAEDVYGQLKAGADFAALAKKYSQDTGTSDDGGKYMALRGQTVAPFDATVFNINLGVVSRPVKTEYGYHLIEALAAIKPGSVTPLAKVRNEIEEQLRSTRTNEALNTWATEIQKRYEKSVSYAAGFAPPATSEPEPETPASEE